MCHSAEDFVDRIKEYCKEKPERFNPANRRAYEENYSVEGIRNRLREVFGGLEVER